METGIGSMRVTGTNMAVRALAPNSPAAYLLLGFIGMAGLFYANLMPVYVGTLIDSAGLSKQQAGYVASVNTYGAAAGAILSILLIKKLPWKLIVASALVPFALLDLLSPFLPDVTMLLIVRFVSGVLGGLVTTTAIAVMARLRHPDRAYGLLFSMAFGFAGLAMLLMPSMTRVWGTIGLFFPLALVSAISLLMIYFLPPYEVKQAKTDTASAGISRDRPRLPLILALASVFLYQGSLMAVFAYLQRIGLDAGLSMEWVSFTLATGSWIGIPGAFLVVLLGLRFGRLLPVIVATAVTVTGLYLFKHSDSSSAYLVAAVSVNLAWAFIVPYLLGICAAFDISGQTAAVAGLMSKLGLASGPVIAALMLTGNTYGAVLNLGITGALCCLLCALKPMFHLAHHNASVRDRQCDPEETSDVTAR